MSSNHNAAAASSSASQGGGRASSAAMSSPPRSDDSTTADLAAMWKRRYLEEVENNSQTNPGTKRKSDNDSDKASPGSLKRLGRGIPKLVSLFHDIPEIVAEADRHELYLQGELDDELADMDPGEAKALKRSHARSHAALKELNRLIPGFQKKIDESEPEDLGPFYGQLREGIINARGDDINHMRSAVATWLNDDFPGETLLSPDSRERRGIDHPTTGMLLCPIVFDWDDDSVRTKLRAFNEEGFDYTCNFLLRVLYRGYKGSATSPDKGYLQSGLLVKAFKYIFTSPNSAKSFSLAEFEEDIDTENVQPAPKTRRTAKSKVPVRKPVAQKLSMKHVTPRSIAYVATQLVFALSSAPNWCVEHAGFDFMTFYETIVDFFEAVKDPAKKEERKKVLQWWDKQIFPHSAAHKQSSTAKADTLKALNGDESD